MSMTSSTNAAAAEAVIVQEQAVLASSAKKHGICMRILHYCRPKTPDGYSMWLTGALVVLVPTWFWLANLWNPHYTPHQAWVWSVPWIVSYAYFIVKLQFVLQSAVEHTEKIGLKEMFISLVALLSVSFTALVLLVLWILNYYYLGGFQVHLLTALITAAGSELLTTATIRFVVNKRYFSGGNSSS